MAATQTVLPDLPGEQAETVSDLLTLLANRRRREVIRVLSNRGHDWCDLRIVAEAVTANIEGREPEDLKRAEVERVRISLYQTHIPSLDEAGILKIRRRGNAIQQGPRFDTAVSVTQAVIDTTLDGGSE